MIRPITEDDRSELNRFTCARLGREWTSQVEELVRWHLVDAIASGRLQGAALDIDGRIVAVAAWMLDEEDETVWRSSLVAVRDGHANRGHGRRMKQHVVDLARAASARAVVSVVHRDNQAMWRINERFGAVFAPMDRLLDYFTATIVLS